MPKPNAKLQDRDWLYEQYIVNHRTYEDIATEANAYKSTVGRALKRFGFDARIHTSKYLQLNDKEWLQARYVEDGMSVKVIAELVGSTPGNVYSALSLMNVKLRNPNEAWHLRFPEGRNGEDHPNWRGGLTSLNNRARATKAYKEWRKAVFERDNYTCQFCHKRGGDLEADHIKQFAYHIEVRLDLDNGRTLCKPCHKTTDTHSRKESK